MHGNKGKIASLETRKKIGLAGKGRKPWNKGLVGYHKGHKPYNIGAKMFHGRKHTPESKEKMRLARLGRFGGDKHWNWNGGVSNERDRARHSTEMRLWHKSVLERDNFTCQKCGKNGDKLAVHHINNFSEFDELRSAIENGITMCYDEHLEFHKKYGRKNNTREQLKEFFYG